MPGFPDYKGLSYVPTYNSPESVPDIPFPGEKVRPPPLKEKKYSDVRLDVELPLPTFTKKPPPPPEEDADE